MGAMLSISDQYKRAKKICPHNHACRFAWSPTIIVPRAVQVSATVKQVKLITAPSHSPEATSDSLNSDVCCSVGHACPVLVRGRRRPKTSYLRRTLELPMPRCVEAAASKLDD